MVLKFLKSEMIELCTPGFELKITNGSVMAVLMKGIKRIHFVD